MLADWNEKEVQTAAKDLASKGHKTLAVRCDVSDDAQVETALVSSKFPHPSCFQGAQVYSKSRCFRHFDMRA